MVRDDFYTKRIYDRCGNSLANGRIMSMFNEDCICMECKEKEKKRPDYAEAEARDIEEYIARNGLYYSGPCYKSM